MERCFFNSCILNNIKNCLKYKRYNKDKLEFFKTIEHNDSLIIDLNLSSNLKKFTFCIEHYNILNQIKDFKQNLKKNNNKIFKEDLILLNNILKNDIEIKKIVSEFEIQNKKILIILINLLTSKKNDKNFELYVLTNLSHLLKEFQICKKIDFNETYIIFVQYFLNLNYNLYDTSKNQKLKISQEEFLLNTLLYELALNNISYLFNNAKEKQLNIELTIKIIENINKVFGELIICYKSIDEPKICNEIFYTILNFLNSFYLSKNKHINLIILTVNIMIKYLAHIIEFLKDSFMNENENQNTDIIKIYMIYLYSLLNELLNININEFVVDDFDKFIREIKSFLYSKEKLILYEQNIKLLEKILHNITLFNTKNEIKI